jgi:hypothetical protein
VWLGRAGRGCNNRAVAYNRRQQRHQGVRYGPPRERDRSSENGVLIGRLLGLGILLLTLGVLVAGAVAFMGDRPGSQGSTRTPRGSTESANPSSSVVATTASFGALIPIEQVASAPPPSGPAISPVSTSGAAQVQVGPGFVTFGTKSDRQLAIVDPRGSFALDERIVWSAYLFESANSADLRVQIFKIDAAQPSGERLLVDEAVTPAVADGQIFLRRIRPSEILDGPGIYVVRYLRGTDLLSEGTVEVTS